MANIAIAGAGPAGLTIARLLQQADVPDLKITVFEKDPSPKSRFFQGGTLDLHPETGLAAVKAAGLYDTMKPHLRDEGEELYFGDKNATIFMHMANAPPIPGFDARPEIDREILKDILLSSVQPELVRWGKHLKAVDGETGILKFSDGSEAGPFDLIIGADGAWSKVRNVLSDEKPSFSGICGMNASVDEKSAGDQWDSISKMVGRGSHFNFSDGKSLMAQRMGDGSLKLGIWTQHEESWPADVLQRHGEDEQGIRSTCLRDFEAWDPLLTRWIGVATRFQSWPLYELPVGHRWNHRKGLTLIGDAAHLMTPFAGEGVNAAMKDALELSEFIVRAIKNDEFTLDEAVQRFEETMFPRAKKVQEETAFNKTMGFRADAPIGFLSGMGGRVAEELGYPLDQGILRWIPVTKVLYSYGWMVSRFGRFRRLLRNWWA